MALAGDGALMSRSVSVSTSAMSDGRWDLAEIVSGLVLLMPRRRRIRTGEACWEEFEKTVPKFCRGSLTPTQYLSVGCSRVDD